MKNTSRNNSSGGIFNVRKNLATNPHLSENEPIKVHLDTVDDISRELTKVAYFLHTKKPLLKNDFFRDEAGKPHIKNGPKISISHSGNLWAVTFMDQNCHSSTEDVGMDIEVREHRKKITPRLLQKILTSGEKPVAGDYLNNFVIKEAYGKLVGRGLGVGFQKVDANILIKKYHSLNLSNDKYVWWILQGSNL